MVVTLSESDWIALGAVLLVMVVGRVTRSESRLLGAALVAALLAPNPSVVAVIALFGVLFKGFDVIRGAA